ARSDRPPRPGPLAKRQEETTSSAAQFFERVTRCLVSRFALEQFSHEFARAVHVSPLDIEPRQIQVEYIVVGSYPEAVFKGGDRIGGLALLNVKDAQVIDRLRKIAF